MNTEQFCRVITSNTEKKPLPTIEDDLYPDRDFRSFYFKLYWPGDWTQRGYYRRRGDIQRGKPLKIYQRIDEKYVVQVL